MRLGGRFIGALPADDFRDDLQQRLASDGHHGFVINLTTRLPPDAFEHLVVHARSSTGKSIELARIKGISLVDDGMRPALGSATPRAAILALVKRAVRVTVQTGPFAGLRMQDVQTWGNGENIGPQLLGVYEQELHPVLLNFMQ